MTISEVDDGAVRLSTLASDVANPHDPAMTGSRVADLAAKLIPCAGADIVRVTSQGDLRIVSLQTAVADPQTAIDTNRDLPVAVGILMARHHIDHQGAHLLLRTTSQRYHRKLRDVAAAVVTTREIPAHRTGIPLTHR